MGQIFTAENQTNHQDSSSEYETDNGEEFFEPENINTIAVSQDNPVHLNSGQMNSTDAVQSNVRFPTTSVITPEQVESFENDLEFYEKVSLVFLLYDSADLALEVLLREESCFKDGIRTTNVISDWARSKHSVSWQDQLLEALCIIKNFSIPKKLGFNKNDLNLRYLPENPNVSLFINITRKALLNICENFNSQKTQQFLCLLREEFENASINYQDYSVGYLEMYFLNCFSRHYIANDDLKNLIKIFKQMELDGICDMLDSVTNRRNDRIKNDTKTKNHRNENKCEDAVQKSSPKCCDSDDVKVKFDLNGQAKDQNYVHRDQVFTGNSRVSDTSELSSRSIYKDDELYYIDPNNPGICLIINQKNFYKETDPSLQLHLVGLFAKPLLDRHGTDVDRDKLQETFKNLGFRVIATENLTHAQIESEIRRVMKLFSKKDSCLVVCIMSHGIEDHIFGVNSIKVEIQAIENILHDTSYTNVLQKPKILIMQSCQGEPLQDVVLHNDEHNTIDSPQKIKNIEKTVHRESNIVTDGPSMTPARTDLLVCSSTIPGYASIRNEKEGSWYIQELCKVIMEERHRRHFVDILTTVNNNVSRRSWYIENEKKTVCMVPNLRSSFRKWLFLPVPERSFS